MSVHVDYVFMEGRPEKLQEIKEMINLKFNIQDSGRVNKFLGVYYEWGCDAKGSYYKMTMEMDVHKLVERQEKFIESGVKVQKTPGATGKTLSKS